MEALRQDCIICHNPLSLYGSVSIKNGVMCRDCVKKISPFLSEKALAEMNLEEVQQHLDYRRNNQEMLSKKKMEKLIEGAYSLFVDENREFLALSKRDDLTKENADLIPVKDIRNVEITRSYQADKENNVDINLFITLDNPQLKSIRVRINPFSNIARDSEEYYDTMKKAALIKRTIKKLNGGAPNE